VTVDFHRRATAEMIEAAQFYERETPGLGLRFLQFVEETAQRAEETPDAGSPIGKRDRRRDVTGFPYSIIYRREPERILVLAVMHHRRKPGYWKWRRYR
jgi:plasmid stabilization system protein ParE